MASYAYNNGLKRSIYFLYLLRIFYTESNQEIIPLNLGGG